VWELLAQGQAPDCVAGHLASLYGITPERALEDVDYVHHLWESKAPSFIALSGQGPPIDSREDGSPIDFQSLEQDRQPVSQRTYRLSGIPFGIRFHSTEIEAILQSVLGHVEEPAATAPSHHFEVLIDGEVYCLRRDGIEVARETLPHSIRHALVFEIAKISYPELRWLIFLHAGAIRDGEGCVLLPGLPGCGKSTLTAALVHRGFQYVAEDIVPISRKGHLVAPVQTRIWLREGGWQALSREIPELQALPGSPRWGREVRYLTPPGIQRSLPDHLPVRCLAFPEYLPGQPPRISPLSAEDTLARLIQTGAWFGDSIDDTQIEELLDWIQATPSYQLRYGTFQDAISAIRSLR